MSGFPEPIRNEVRRRSAFRCCRCQKISVEVHHIIPSAEGGPDTLENAAPLCPSCHSDFGANPVKRKEIREMRDWWYRCIDDGLQSLPAEWLERYDALAERVESSADLMTFFEAARGAGQAGIATEREWDFRGEVSSSETGPFQYQGGVTLAPTERFLEGLRWLNPCGGSVKFTFSDGHIDFMIGYDSVWMALAKLNETHLHLQLIAVNGSGRHASAWGVARLHLTMPTVTPPPHVPLAAASRHEAEVSLLELHTGST
jgi:HNH endonuclease